MYIARLQLKGFKSFGGSHELPLSPGITAIVGPNGSGKSNLLDALRWVLGDTHASKLRISRQNDLLFQGSSSEGPASEAEVAIQLREGTRLCAIKRRITDNGAQSIVDGVKVNLSELDEAKRLWQMGGDRFAFIGQGDVTEVIQQRPSARRMLLESLFGIDAYRKRRDEASKRLGDAKEEYARLRTFSAELSARRDEIAPAAAKAAEAQKLLDSLEEERKLLYWSRRAKNEQSVILLREGISELTKELRSREEWKRLWERATAFLDGNMSELSQTKQNQIRDLDDAKSSLSSLTKTAYGYGASLVSSKRRAAQINEERAALSEKIEKLRAEADASRKETSAMTKKSESVKKKLADAEGVYNEHIEKTERERAERERLNNERGQIEGSMSALKGRIKSMGEALKSLRGQKKDTTAHDQTRAIKSESETLEKRHEELLLEQDSIAARHRGVYARLQEISAELQRNRREASKLTSRLSELQEQAQAEVYPRPVQHILSAAKLGRLDAKPCAVIDAFTCPTELATAMEAFLGGRQFWVLVDTMDEAGRCIDQLKKNNAGRATFLPLERGKPRNIDERYRLPPSGVVGWVMKLIEPSLKWRTALEHIMGDLLVVEDYSLGQKLMRESFRCPVVTLDGDVFQTSGSISGGRTQKSGRAMEIKSAVSKMERDADEASRHVEALSSAFTQLEEEEALAAEKKNTISSEIRELAAQRSALDARREEMAREKTRSKNERDAIISAIKDAAAQYAGLFKSKNELDAEPIVTETSSDEGLIRDIERLKSEAALAEEKGRSSLALFERSRRDLQSAERALSELDEEFASRDSEIITARGNLKRLSVRVSAVVAKKRAVMAEMASFAERYEKTAAKRGLRTARLETAKVSLSIGAQALSEHEAKLAELSRERTELIQTWEDRYPYPSAGAPLNEWGDPDEARRRVRELERDVKSLGEIDMGALSEDKNLRERLSYLGDQLSDVSGGMAELERMITDADEQARTIFTEAMAEIDGKFNGLFRQLFGGGDARLEFIEGSSGSLWDSGIDVIARPPGKHPQSITQLSGGEQSLSAIALLFASLEVAKSPIAVLDEVDAALDEVNLRRFAELAKEAAKERQIFVMTHRRVTMERAEALYGVTMSEPGLSQVIGVRIEDWA
ncbi:chromosome partition protein Smc [Synergistales bacterium]|nr:chromosome partition protein Smc [Synergistales bacterium]